MKPHNKNAIPRHYLIRTHKMFMEKNFNSLLKGMRGDLNKWKDRSYLQMERLILLK